MTADLFAVCPHDIARGIERWTFLNTFANRRLDLGSRYGLFLDFAEFAEALDEGRLLWAFLNPADYLKARTRLGYEAVARPAGCRDVAYLVGPAEGAEASSLEALAGKRLACVRGYLAALVTHRLREAGVSFETVPAKSYGEVMTAVGRGDAEFGVTYNDHFDRLSAPVAGRYRVGLRIDAGLAHVFAAHPSMPGPARQALRELLLGAAASAEGAALLKELGFASFEAVPDGPYRELESVIGAAS